MGFTRKHLIVFLSVTVVFLIGTRLFFQTTENEIQFEKKSSSDDLTDTITKLLQQRNNLSRALNLKQQKIGQMECKEMARSKNAHKVSSTGGWCASTSKENSGQHKTDRQFAAALATFFKGKYVASFGDGPGRYKQLLLDSGLPIGYDAYDGAPFTEETSEGRVQYLDLTLPQYGLPLYDWILSLEVAEHIPKEYESIYIDNIVRHAKEGIIISWAKPGQDGYSHVNNRPFSYVKTLFENLGFKHDGNSSTKLQKVAKLEWLQWNTNVFRREKFRNIENVMGLFT